MVLSNIRKTFEFLHKKDDRQREGTQKTHQEGKEHIKEKFLIVNDLKGYIRFLI